MEDYVVQAVNNQLEKWGQDENTRDLLDKTKKWLGPIDNNDHKNIFISLFKNFNYYSREGIYNIFRDIHNNEIKKIDPNCRKTLFLPIISSEGRLNHSYDMISCYQTANRLGKMIFPTEMNMIEKHYPLNDIENIVLIDDMTGTGETIKDSIEFMINNYINVFINKNIYIILVEGSEDGIKNIKELKNIYDIELNVICNNIYKKAFSPEYIFEGLECAESRDILLEYEKEITNNKEDILLGHNQSEALIAFYYDTPNNTLSSFWFHNDKIGWIPLFPRNIVYNPPWAKDVKKKMKNAKNVNYNLFKTMSKAKGD